MTAPERQVQAGTPAARVRDLRAAADLLLGDAARKARVSPSYMARVEAGLVHPSALWMGRVEAALDPVMQVDPFGDFNGTPAELETALWPLGVRLRAAEDMTEEDERGRRTEGTVEWYPDNSEVVVTPDERATPDERIHLLRHAERMLLGFADGHDCYRLTRDSDGKRFAAFQVWA